MKIIIDDLSGKEIASLLLEHMLEMHQNSPPESIHALDIDALKKPDITFWSLWEESELLGCVALKKLDSSHAEIKSMRVASRYQGQGIANIIMEHLIAESEKCGYQYLSLETGSMESFSRARRLYEKYGFNYCEPFADYKADPNSVFMTRHMG